MLTRKQHELLLFINSHLQAHGVSPSFDEMKEALGLKSKSGIHRLITGLEERGFLKRLPHRARALEVTRLPEEVGVPMPMREAPVSGRFAPNVIQGNFRGLSGAAPAGPAAESVQLPLYGKIAAGTAIEALRDNTRTMDVPASMLGRGEHFAQFLVLVHDGVARQRPRLMLGDDHRGWVRIGRGRRALAVPLSQGSARPEDPGQAQIHDGCTAHGSGSYPLIHQSTPSATGPPLAARSASST